MVINVGKLNFPAYVGVDWAAYLSCCAIGMKRAAKMGKEERDRFIASVPDAAFSEAFGDLLKSGSIEDILQRAFDADPIFVLTAFLSAIAIASKYESNLGKYWSELQDDLLAILEKLSASQYLLRARLLSKLSYEEYLNSPEWAAKRRRALMQADYRCKWCGSMRNLDVHHNTYIHFRDEWDNDLTVACRKCHSIHHNELPSYKENAT